MPYNCSKCQAPLNKGQRFCGNCGQEHNWDQQQQNAATAADAGKNPKKSRGCTIVAVTLLGLMLVTCIAALNSDPNTELGNDAARQRLASAEKTNKPVNTPDKPPAEPVKQVIEVTAVKLAAEYDNNTVAADGKYENQIVRITGTVKDIGKDMLDTSYIILDGKNSGFVDIQCMFREENEPALSRLSKGQQVTVEGQVAGETILNVIVRYCELK